MTWSFDCFICGYRWEEEHRNIHKEDFIHSIKKEGRPMVDCPKCRMADIHAPIVGNLKH